MRLNWPRSDRFVREPTDVFAHTGRGTCAVPRIEYVWDAQRCCRTCTRLKRRRETSQRRPTRFRRGAETEEKNHGPWTGRGSFSFFVGERDGPARVTRRSRPPGRRVVNAPEHRGGAVLPLLPPPPKRSAPRPRGRYSVARRSDTTSAVKTRVVRFPANRTKDKRPGAVGATRTHRTNRKRGRV